MSRLLVLGSGGREHALIWSLAGEAAGHQLFCAPGNVGTAELATNLAVDLEDHEAVMALAREQRIDLTIVGPEGPLAAGIVDHFQAENLPIFGPRRDAARLESSKLFARELMAEAGIPQPAYVACHSLAESREAALAQGLPVVLKADGLAAGKGVIICATDAELEAALERFFVGQDFGPAGLVLSVEECLVGPEMSVFAVCAGEQCAILGTAQDYKRAFEGDTGPNTGGMGSIAPAPLATPAMLQQVSQRIFRPALAALAGRGTPYTGFLYAGLMIVDGEPYVIEFNVRLGDPETQVVLPLLADPLAEIITAALEQKLPPALTLKPAAAVCVVLAAKGYPGAYPTGLPIGGLEQLDEEITLFHAGTMLRDGRLVSSGGRVLSLVATAPDHRQAAARIYRNITRIDMPGSRFRSDIGRETVASAAVAN